MTAAPGEELIRDELLRAALREEAYRVPVRLTAGALGDRLEAQRRATRWQPVLAGLGVAAAVAVVAVLALVQPNLGIGNSASGTPGCAVSAPTRYDDWVEVGGPRAFFPVEPGSLAARPTGANLRVRVDPEPAPGQQLAMWAERLDGSQRFDATDRSHIPFWPFIPNLPGRWYLMNQVLPAPGCWRLVATLDDEVIGTAIVDVAPRPVGSGQPCDESPATMTGEWWYEVGGPNAFFQIEPGTMQATTPGSTWQLIVRIEPGRDGRRPDVSAQKVDGGRRIDGTFNSPVDPANVFHFDQPAPSLPGAWYLYEQAVPEAGCWRLEARIDGQLVGGAVVDVAPNPGATAVTRVPLKVAGVATECSSFGGCAYFATLTGHGPNQRAEFDFLPVAPGASYPPHGGPYQLVMHDLTETLPPGSYTLDFESFLVSDAIFQDGRDMTHMGECSVDFGVGADAVSIRVEFVGERCSAVDLKT